MNLADLFPISRETMHPPAGGKFVAGSLLVALLLDILPWQGAALLARPDFMLVMLLYWAVNEPRHIGQGIAFCLALLMDVADSALLGQHALVYVTAIFLGQALRLRILQLTLTEQALHAGAILFAAQGLTLLLNLMLGRNFPGLLLFAAPVLGGVLWPLLSLLAGLQRFRRPPPTVMQ
jgi:rod shape-determining protein MreD